MIIIYKNCLRCGLVIKSDDESSCITQHCDFCFEYFDLERETWTKRDAWFANSHQTR
jgi:hypothetical protein